MIAPSGDNNIPSIALIPIFFMKQLFFHLFATSAFAEAKTETVAASVCDGVNLGIDHNRWTRRLLGREDRDANGFTKVSVLLDMSRVQLEAYLDATEAALRTAMVGSKPPKETVTQRFTGTDLFPTLETFGEREAMFFARDNRMVPITNEQFKDMTPEQRCDPTLEMALFRSATWPYFGYPRGFLAKERGEYRVRFAGRALRQVRDFRLAPAYVPIAMSFRARQPSRADVSGDVRKTRGWMDLQPETREFETTIHLKAGETL